MLWRYVELYFYFPTRTVCHVCLRRDLSIFLFEVPPRHSFTKSPLKSGLVV